MAYQGIVKWSNSGTLANSATLTITHDQLSEDDALVISGIAQNSPDWGAELVANLTSSVNADTGQTGTANNGASVTGGWLELDGTNDYLTYPDSTSYSLGSSDFTIEFDLQVDTTSGAHHVVNHAGPGELYAWAFVVSGTTLFCFAGSSTNRDVLNDVAFSSSIGTGATYKVALCRNGSNFYGYLNGTRVFSQTSALSILDPASVIMFGRPSSVSTEYLDGRVRRFRLKVGTALYTGSSYTTSSSDFTAQGTYSPLVLGTDFTAEINSTRTATTITNTSGSSYSAVFTVMKPA